MTHKVHTRWPGSGRHVAAGIDLVNAGDYAQYVRDIKGNRVANFLLDGIGLTLRPELDN